MIMNVYDEVILKKFPKAYVISVYEYPTCYVYNLSKSKPEDTHFPVINKSFAVDKKTKEVTVFFPYNMSIDEYKKGKQVR